MPRSFSILRAVVALALFVGAGSAAAQQRPAAPPPQPAQQQALPAVPGGPIPPSVIAIVSTQRLIAQAKAPVSIRNQIEQMRVQAQTQITRSEEAIGAEQQELTRQRSVLSPQAFQERERAFRQRVSQMQEQVQALQRDLENAYNNAMNEVQTAIRPIYQDTLRARNINIILDASQIIIGERALDITDEVIARLDAALPNVRVQPPPGLSGAPTAQQPRPPAQAPAQQPRR